MVQRLIKMNLENRDVGKLETHTVKISELVEADYNPNVMEERDFQNLENSIERYGYIEPIIVNKRNNVIVGGHHRLRALKNKGDYMKSSPLSSMIFHLNLLSR